MNEKRYWYCDENGKIHIVTEEDLPKCPKTNGISPAVWIMGTVKETSELEHINCRCSMELKE